MFNKNHMFVLSLIFMGSVGSAHAVVYDAFADFSLAHNPNGVWSYGDGVAGSTFNAFTANFSAPQFVYWQGNNPVLSTPIVLKNTTGSAFATSTLIVPNDALDIHPGQSSDVIVQFTAPNAGVYNYTGLFETLDFASSTGVIGLIYHNSTQLYSQSLAGLANSTTLMPGDVKTFSGSINLAAGDTLSFAVNNNGDFAYDSTGFSATISSGVPEPSTWAMMLLGFAGLSFASYRAARKSAA